MSQSTGLLFAVCCCIVASAHAFDDDDDNGGVPRLLSVEPQMVDDGAAVIVTGPSSCETCAVFDGAQWCANSMMCYIPPARKNSTDPHPHKKRKERTKHGHTHAPSASLLSALAQPEEDAQEELADGGGDVDAHDFEEDVRQMCAKDCGGDCGGLVQCFAKANTSCGACVFVGGWWAPNKALCFVGDETTPEVKSNCLLGDGTNVCHRREPDCPACERTHKPLQCTPQIAVVIIASLFAAAFLAAFAMTCYRAEKRIAASAINNSPGCTAGAAGCPSSQRGTPLSAGHSASRTALDVDGGGTNGAGGGGDVTERSRMRLRADAATEAGGSTRVSGVVPSAGFGINTSIVSADGAAPMGGGDGATISPSERMQRKRRESAARAQRSATLPPLPATGNRPHPHADEGGLGSTGGTTSPIPEADAAGAASALRHGSTSSAGGSSGTVPHGRHLQQADDPAAAKE